MIRPKLTDGERDALRALMWNEHDGIRNTVRSVAELTGRSPSFTNTALHQLDRYGLAHAGLAGALRPSADVVMIDGAAYRAEAVGKPALTCENGTEQVCDSAKVVVGPGAASTAPDLADPSREGASNGER